MSKLILQKHGLSASRIGGLRIAAANDDGLTESELWKRVRILEHHIENMLEISAYSNIQRERDWCAKEIGEAIIEIGNNLIPAIEAIDEEV